MVTWYNNTRKRNKKELLDMGKKLTFASIFCTLGMGFFAFVSLIHPIISLWLIPTTIIISTASLFIWLNLNGVKREYYERFCK